MITIEWWKQLEWTVQISWSKNATLPILWASLLIWWKVTLKNIPKIGDVVTFLEILTDIGVKYKYSNNILELDTSKIETTNLDIVKIQKIRSSIFLISPLLHFFGSINMPFPWGCSIWKRPLDAHINWLKKIWYNSKLDGENIIIDWSIHTWKKIINAWFGVWSTENLIIANVLRDGETIIMNCATEPHVMCLIDFLRKAGANIKIRYNHEIIIKWVYLLKSNFSFDVIHDYIESGTFMVMWALASKEYIDIENSRQDDLFSFIDKLHEAWVKTKDLWNDKLRVYKADKINNVNIQTNIFPWFPTDLQSPFSILMTQAIGTSYIHEVLFEWRLNFLIELEKMWVRCKTINPHEAIIYWSNKLKWWSVVTSWDLRAWAAMVIAALLAKWQTKITKVEYIFRWYEKFIEKLKILWANININK